MLKKLQQSLHSISPFKKVVVGVSGGPDSVALADLLIRLGYQVTLAHLNHGLRGKQSNADAQFVEKLATEWGVPCVTQKIKLPTKGNLENNARLARYAFLEKVRRDKKAKFIAVAHHLDDQIETILMHKQRGSGLRGLRGMSAQNGHIIRPLLSVKKAKLIGYLKRQSVDYRIDESNFDTTFKRNLLRHVVIPELKKKDKDFEKKLLEVSNAAQFKCRQIEKQTAKWIRTNVRKTQFDRLMFLKLSDDAQAEVLFQLAGRLDVYRANIDEVKKLIWQGHTGKQKKLADATFQIQYGKVIFDKIISVSSATYTVDMQQSCVLKKDQITWGQYKISYRGSHTLFVRSWKPGDRFKPTGMNGTKKLQDFFVDQKVPRSERNHIPIIVNKSDQIVAISDLRIAKGANDLKKSLQIDRIQV